MSTFRIVPTYGLATLRVIHGPGEQLAHAIIIAEADGSLTLFPSRWDTLPTPLTGESMNFPDLDAVERFLGIQAQQVAA